MREQRRSRVIAMTCSARLRSPVPTAVETVPGSLPATCLQRGSAGEGGECCFAADATTVGPADQKLRSDDRPDSGFGEQRRPRQVLFDQREEFRVQLGGLREQESNPRGNRPQHQDGHPTIHGGADGNGKQFNEFKLLEERLAAQSGSQVLRCHHDQALELIDGLRAADQNRLPGGHDLP